MTDKSAWRSPPLIDPAARAAAPGTGGVPAGDWSALVPELSVSDLAESLSFWLDLLGFRIAFDRPVARFAYLENGPLRVML